VGARALLNAGRLGEGASAAAACGAADLQHEAHVGAAPSEVATSRKEGDAPTPDGAAAGGMLKVGGGHSPFGGWTDRRSAGARASGLSGGVMGSSPSVRICGRGNVCAKSQDRAGGSGWQREVENRTERREQRDDSSEEGRERQAPSLGVRG